MSNQQAGGNKPQDPAPQLSKVDGESPVGVQGQGGNEIIPESKTPRKDSDDD